MNVKIIADNVYALFPNSGSLSYDQVYNVLGSQLTGADFIFTKRTPGAGYLQWDLPGDGWMPLSKADPLVAAEVKTEKELRFRHVMSAFGTQQVLAQKVLTVPDDDFVFFRPTATGGVEVKITVWGYKYPVVVGGSGFTDKIDPKPSVQEVVVSFLCDGQRLPGYEFTVNGYLRKTDDDGMKVLGELPIGNEYEVQTATGHKVTITVTEGRREYPVDVTDYVTVTVCVSLDGQPYPGAACHISYWNHDTTLTTGYDGCATTTLPLANGHVEECTVVVDGERQQRILKVPSNLFQFDLKSPEPVPADNTLPSEPSELPELSESSEPSESFEPSEFSEPFDPSEPSRPSEPSESSEPSGSSGPSESLVPLAKFGCRPGWKELLFLLFLLGLCALTYFAVTNILI